MINYIMNNQFAKYLVVGVLNTLVGFVSFKIFQFSLHNFGIGPEFSNSIGAVLGQFVGIVFSYVMNSKITFNKKLSLAGFMAFAGPLVILQIVVMGAGMYVLTSNFHVNNNVSYVLLTMFNVVAGFLIVKFSLNKFAKQA